MKRKFVGYYLPSRRDFDKLWKSCIFSFDANILLNLYRYSSETTKEFIKLIEQLKDRIWITHQAAYEYQNNRLTVISEQGNSYDKLLDVIANNRNKVAETLRSERHPHIKNPDKQILQIDKIFGNIKSQLEKEKIN